MSEDQGDDRIVAALDAAEVLSDGENPAPLDESFGTDNTQTGTNTSGPSNRGAGALVLRYGGTEIDVRCALLPLTDLGNAQRFVARFGDVFKYVEQWGWLAWDGRRWNTHEADAILSRAVHDTIKAIAEEAHQLRLLEKLWADDIAEMADD